MARQVIGVCDEALSKLPQSDDKLRGQATDYSDLKVGIRYSRFIAEFKFKIFKFKSHAK